MPKTKEQCEQIRNERIDKILDSALYLFVMKGYDAVNLDEVTKEAKCSHGLLYHYFKGKEELYLAVINQKVIPYIKEIIEGVNLNQKARFVIQDLLDVILNKIKAVDDKNAWNIYLFLNIHLKKDLFGKSKKEKLPSFTFVQGLIERGQKEGDFNDHDSVELTISILSLIKGLSFTRIHIGHKRFMCPKSNIIMKMLY